MNKLIRKILAIVTFVNVFCILAAGQTNVSGGIFTNTTWTLANSPYIVVDTVVVFPGVTLTIEPGVTVKFDTLTRLEIRQANLVAMGTVTDSITFTSNSSAPVASGWSEIYFNDDNSTLLNFCKFQYATTAIRRNIPAGTHSLTIKNSDFKFNNICINSSPPFYAHTILDSCAFMNNLIVIKHDSKIFSINHCIVSNNQIGLDISYSKVQNSIVDSNLFGIIYGLNDTVINCKIRYNDIGLQNPQTALFGVGGVITGNEIENNNYGIWLNVYIDHIYCNKVCNNNIYDLYYNNAGNMNVSNNYWCTPDSATISGLIYDGYDNINLGLISFMPIDTLQCYLTTPINEIENQSVAFSIFPNPVTNYLNLFLQNNFSKAELKIYNMT